MIPGEIITADGDIELNKGRKTVTLTVANTGDRPIQVGSHYHFFETNPALKFERKKARGMRLDIAAGTAVRFEPGQTREVTLVALAGGREVYGFRQDVMGKLVRTWIASHAGDECRGRRLRRHVRADHGRPRPARRHRSLHRGGEGFHHLWRGGEIRRRQGDPRRHGPEPSHQQARRRRHRHHQCADPRSLGHRQGRCRHQGRPHRRHRQGRQSGYPARRDHRHRARHRGHRRGRQDPHRRRLRHPHPLHLPAADRGGADVRHHLHAGRRHRPRGRHQRHHLHAGAVAHRAHDPGGRRVSDEPRLRRQGQRVAARCAGGAGQGRRLRPQAARGLGHDAGRHRLLPVGRRGSRHPGDDPHRHAQRVRLRRGHHQGVQGPHHPRLPYRRRRRRPCARHHQGRRPEERAAVLHQPDPAVHPQHHRRASRHADGVPPSRSRDRRGSGVCGKPHPQGDHRAPRTSCTISARSP